MKRYGILLIVLAAAAALSASPVLAGCIPGKLATNVSDNPDGYYAYIGFGDDTGDATHFIGAFWDTDTPAAGNTGTFSVENWLIGQAGYPDSWYVYIDMGNAAVEGCPTGSLTMFLEDLQTDTFVLWTADEGVILSSFDFDFSYANGTAGVFVAAPSLRPRVNSVASAGTDRNLNVTIPDPSAGHYQQGTAGAITGINIYSQAGDTAPDSTDTLGWTSIGSVGAAGGTTDIVVDCSNTASQQWIAAGIAVDGNVFVLSEATEIECDPFIADPAGRKFKMIPREDVKKTKSTR